MPRKKPLDFAKLTTRLYLKLKYGCEDKLPAPETVSVQGGERKRVVDTRIGDLAVFSMAEAECPRPKRYRYVEQSPC